MIDNSLIEFVKVNFPKEANELKQGCVNIHSIIDLIIDKLIDKGSSVLKEQRDFELASQYTQKAESLFKLNKIIEDSLKNVISDMNEEETLYDFNQELDESFYDPEIDNTDSMNDEISENSDEKQYDEYNKYYDSLRFK